MEIARVKEDEELLRYKREAWNKSWDLWNQRCLSKQNMRFFKQMDEVSRLGKFLRPPAQ